MADGYVQTSPDSTGGKVQTFQNTVGGQVVQAQAVVLVDNGGQPITVSYQAASVSNSVDTVSTQSGHTHTILFILNVGSGAYTATLSLPTSGRPQASVCRVRINLPASTNPTLEVHNGTSAGTILYTAAGTGTASTLYAEFIFNGTAWVLLASNNVS